MKRRSEKEKERETSSSSLREQRNLREKERRIRMKHLFSHLSSLISTQKLPVPRLIDQATVHMKKLKERVMELKERKETLQGGGVEPTGCSRSSSSRSPILQINAQESSVEMNLIFDLESKNFMLHDVLSVLEEEGAEVISVNLHNMEDKTICTIIAKAILARIGIDASRMEKRVRDLIF